MQLVRPNRKKRGRGLVGKKHSTPTLIGYRMKCLTGGGLRCNDFLYDLIERQQTIIISIINNVIVIIVSIVIVTIIDETTIFIIIVGISETIFSSPSFAF